ncbi:hypothetical protein E5288_WYG016263 [Bos mutus]|uniref:Uncharacterized protein n=1 Tax=Bos mutus TaxID=72004 RepID=A0A6B0RK92_9CETA|nr:hypothetical protein [Bos mutus]
MYSIMQVTDVQLLSESLLIPYVCLPPSLPSPHCRCFVIYIFESPSFVVFAGRSPGTPAAWGFEVCGVCLNLPAWVDAAEDVCRASVWLPLPAGGGAEGGSRSGPVPPGPSVLNGCLVYLPLVTPDPSDDQDVSVLPGGHGPVPPAPTPDQQIPSVVCKRKAAES